MTTTDTPQEVASTPDQAPAPDQAATPPTWEPESPAKPPSASLFPPIPPPPPGFIATRWAGPSYGGGPAAWLAALVGGLATAIALPLTRPGIGWFLVGLVIVGTVAHAARYAPIPDDRTERLVRAGWAVLALALLSVGTFLNAYWLHYICALGALGCFALAVAGGQSVRAVIFAAATPVLAFFRSIPWLSKGFGAWNRARDKQTTTSRTGLAIVATVVLLVVFGGLFAWADAAFAEIVSNAIPDLNFVSIRNGLLKLIIGGLLTAGAIFVVLAPPDLSGLERPASRRIGTIELVLPLGALVLLFAGFVAVQMSYLFSKAAPKGHTFSTYAVQGFGQLVVVTLLTLVVIGCAARWAPKETPRERLILRALLGALVALSLVIVASAGYRMWLYMNALGWTRERLFFGAVEIFLGFVFLLVIVAGVRLRAAWFPRAIIASFALMLLGLASVNPERYIAEQNINRFEDNRNNPAYLKTFDLGYLQFLTSDAIGELVKLPEPYKSCALLRIQDDLENTSEQWYSWNLSRQNAAAEIKKHQIDQDACSKWNELRARNASR
ncbi:DUF4153 domain-containing protein [Allorhizocola rhizosphaerae]|uniref:DUF4153 domain-containing protein n=1 Tax=Allorhizocola rhizosphaerae TaxID=1872709 RepID=UPI000E3E3E16|nr:DUF4173 domain-containing protein [Allorhizocola rhizosphaerae]